MGARNGDELGHVDAPHVGDDQGDLQRLSSPDARPRHVRNSLPYTAASCAGLR